MKLSSASEKADTSAAYFIPALGINFRIANSCTRWRFTGLSQDGGQAEFSKNLCAS
jgi:hypothetical protein